MQATIKIPVDKLNESFIKDMKEKYGDAELEITINQKPDFQALKEDDFWNLIDLLNWEASNNQEIVAPLVKELASLPVGQIYNFQEILAQKLYQLDQKKIAKRIGEFAYQKGEYFSVDHFLHSRACVISNGRDTFESVLKKPKAMLKNLTFEPLLVVASAAYERKTGKPFVYVPSRSYETYSNEKGWK